MYSEKDVEMAFISWHNHQYDFLKFIARQYRTQAGVIDALFYNPKWLHLEIVEIKKGRAKDSAYVQLQRYMNYFRVYLKEDHEVCYHLNEYNHTGQVYGTIVAEDCSDTLRECIGYDASVGLCLYEYKGGRFVFHDDRTAIYYPIKHNDNLLNYIQNEIKTKGRKQVRVELTRSINYLDFIIDPFELESVWEAQS